MYSSAQSVIGVGQTVLPLRPSFVYSAFRVAEEWGRLQNGESFWTGIRLRFMERNLTRADVVELIVRGLDKTCKRDYVELMKVFNMRASDAEDFVRFLRNHRIPFVH